jgi:hypothetical protein
MISLFLFLLTSLSCVITANLIKNNPTQIVDIIHHHVPLLKAPYISDTLVLLQTVFTTTVAPTDIISEMFIIISILQVFRILCSISTVLPPLKNYHDKYRLGGINGTGTEYIFSGHACYSCVSAIYLYKAKIFNVLTLIIYNIISQSLIVITRNHYTVDVVLAWIIAPLTYGNIQLCKKDDTCSTILNNLL